MNKKKPRLYNKEITAYYIHWASKFATMIIKHKQTTDYIHWASKIATSANKHTDKIIYKTDNTSIEFKKGKPCWRAAAQAPEQDDETVLVQHLYLPHSER